MSTYLEFVQLSMSMYDRDFILMHEICYMCDWPPRSPDFNVIENMWSLLKAKVSTRIPKTIDELWNIAKDGWHRNDDTYIKNLFVSIQKWLDTVIKMKGHHSKYWQIFVCVSKIFESINIFFCIFKSLFELWPQTFGTIIRIFIRIM